MGGTACEGGGGDFSGGGGGGDGGSSFIDSWATPGTLYDHYATHGVEMGANSPAQYVEWSQEYLEEADEQGLPMKEDRYSNIYVANFDTGESAIYSYDRKTVTYYIVDISDIEDYLNNSGSSY